MNQYVYLASPNDVIREGLSAILSAEGFEVIRSTSEFNSSDFDGITEKVLAIYDQQSVEHLSSSIKSIVTEQPLVDVVVVTSEFDLAVTLDCFQAGAKGVIVRNASSKPLITALRLIALGERVFPSEMIDALEWNEPMQISPHARDDAIADANLSRRELDVLCCLMAGYPNKLIARELDVCEATVKVHVKAILRKLNVRNRTQAAIWASAHNVATSERMAELN